MKFIQIWVIKWNYSDNSAFGIVRAYENHIDAQKDFAMLENHSGSKTFEIEEVSMLMQG